MDNIDTLLDGLDDDDLFSSSEEEQIVKEETIEAEEDTAELEELEQEESVEGELTFALKKHNALREKAVVRHSPLDVLFLNKALKKNQLLREAKAKLEIGYVPGKELLEDIFYAFYLRKPVLREQGTLRFAYHMNHEIISNMVATKEYLDMHQQTKGNHNLSAIGTIGIADKILTALDGKKLMWASKLAQMEDKTAEILTAVQSLELRMSDPLKFNMREEDIVEQVAELKAGVSKIETAEQAYVEKGAMAFGLELGTGEKGQKIAGGIISQKEASKTHTAVTAALGKETKSIAQMSNVVETYSNGNLSLSQDTLGSGADATFDIKLQIANEVAQNKKLQIIAELAGKFKNIALEKQRSRVKQTETERAGVERGNDISRLMPEEILLLSMPETEAFFDLGFIEETLLQYKLEERKKKGQGPIILMLDSTGSMDSPTTLGGTREQIAKGMAFGLAAIAKAQERDFQVIFFWEQQTYEMYFEKGQGTPAEFIKLATLFHRGSSTYFDYAMKKAIEVRNITSLKKADFIIIGDGEGTPAEAIVSWFNKIRKEEDISCFGILIGNESGGNQLRRICDNVITMNTIFDENVALDNIFTI